MEKKKIVSEYVCDFCGKKVKGALYRFKMKKDFVWVGKCCWDNLVAKNTPVK